VMRGRVGSADVEDRKLEVVAGTLRTFGPELKDQRPVKAVAEFSATHQRAPLEQVVTGTGFFEQRVEHTAYAHWWLSMSFTLADGVTVTVDGSSHANRAAA
jgi:hypothetical protein